MSLCRDVLARMRRDARQNACTCAVQWLTPQVMSDVQTAVLAEGTTVDPVERWGGDAGTAHGLRQVQASVVDARIPLWTADRGWLGAKADAKVLRTVREAAAGVVETAPTFNPRTAESKPESIAMPSAPASDVAATDDVPDPYAGYEALEAVVSAVGEAVERVAEAVKDGRPPTGLRSHLLRASGSAQRSSFMRTRLPAGSRKAQSRTPYGCSVGSWTTSAPPACSRAKVPSRSAVARMMRA